MAEWISVKDRLPEPIEPVLVTDGHRVWVEARDYWLKRWKISHWMPLPEPPGGEK